MGVDLRWKDDLKECDLWLTHPPTWPSTQPPPNRPTISVCDIHFSATTGLILHKNGTKQKYLETPNEDYL